MSARRGLPESQPGYRWELNLPEAPPRRRSPWPWIVSIVIIAALIAGAWFAGEWLARDTVERTVRTQAIDSLGLDRDQQIDVQIDGAVIPQLIAGSLTEVRVSSEDVVYGAFEGDVAVVATDVPVRGDADLGSASARVTMTEAQLRRLLAEVEGFPAESLRIESPNVTMQADLTVFGTVFTVGVGLAPGVETGDIALTPASLRLADAEVSADALREQFGVLADAVLRTWRVCIADEMPAGLALTSIVAEAGAIVVDFDIAPGMLRDPALQEPGVCA